MQVAPEVFENQIGVVMETVAWLDLRGTRIVRNASYGMWFGSDDCPNLAETCPPDVGHLTGFGNVIPEPLEKDGNGAGAFSSGVYPCLTLPEGCEP